MAPCSSLLLGEAFPLGGKPLSARHAATSGPTVVAINGLSCKISELELPFPPLIVLSASRSLLVATGHSHVRALALSQSLFVPAGSKSSGRNHCRGGGAEDACGGADGYERNICRRAVLPESKRSWCKAYPWRDARSGVARHDGVTGGGCGGIQQFVPVDDAAAFGCVAIGPGNVCGRRWPPGHARGIGNAQRWRDRALASVYKSACFK